MTSLDHINPASARQVTGTRRAALTFIERPLVRNLVMALILFNAVTLGLETYPGIMASPLGPLISLTDRIIVWVFVLEILIKLYGYGWRFFLSGWRIFDLVVVGVSIVPQAGSFSVLRALRVMRAFRLLSAVPSMRRVVESLFAAIPGMGAIILVLGLIFYVCAVMATKLYADTNPELFGTLGASSFTLFQVMTLEGWAMEVARPVMAEHAWAWIFFLVFIVLTSFAVLNLFIAIIVDTMQRTHVEEEEQRDAEELRLIRDQHAELLNELREVKAMIARNGVDSP